MISIRIHGRGGQGNVVAANLLAEAAFSDGYAVQAFPSFGAERRGAPVTAFVRLARQPILSHCEVLHPDFLIVQDESLLHMPGITEGLKPDGGVLINSNKAVESCGLDDSCRAVAVTASTLAREVLGRPIPNTALVAAFAVLTKLISLQALEHALEDHFGGDVLAANLALIKKAAQMVHAGVWEAGDAAGD